jgi:hypothetical protein
MIWYDIYDIRYDMIYDIRYMIWYVILMKFIADMPPKHNSLFLATSEIGLQKLNSFATTVSWPRIWKVWVIGIERNVCRCTFNRYSVITQFAKLAAGEQLCRRCTHRKLYKFKTFKPFYWKITNFNCDIVVTNMGLGNLRGEW